MVKATETRFAGVLEGRKQYQVPLYQRTYSWGKKQLDQLWSDIAELAAARRDDPALSHFIGSLDGTKKEVTALIMEGRGGKGQRVASPASSESRAASVRSVCMA